MRLRTLRCLLWGWGRNELGLRAAALTYYAMFSLFPLALLLVAVAGLWLRSPEMQQRLLEWLLALFPHEAESAVRALRDLTWPSSTAGAVAGLTLLWSASGYIRLLLATIDRIHARTTAAPRRTWWLPHALGTAVVVFIPPALVFGLTLGSTLLHLFLSLPMIGHISWLTPGLMNAVLILTLAALALYLAFQFVPAERVPRRASLKAALFTAGGWGLAGQLLREYLHTAWTRYNVLYGPLASVIVLLFYLYFLNVILLLGAQLHAIWCSGAACRAVPLPRGLQRLFGADEPAPSESSEGAKG